MLPNPLSGFISARAYPRELPKFMGLFLRWARVDLGAGSVIDSDGRRPCLAKGAGRLLGM